MVRSFKIFTKVFLSHIVIGLVSVISLSVIFYFLFQQAIIERTINQLSSINILKKNQIEEYFKTTRITLEFHLAKNNLLAHYEDMKDLSSVESDIEAMKKSFDFVNILVTDDQYHKIIGTSGDSLLLAQIPNLHDPVEEFRTFEIILPRGKNTTIVYVLPILDHERIITGYLFIEEDFKKIQHILYEVTGMGNTGESYLVGADLEMRSASRFYPGKSPATITVNTVATRDTFAEIFTGGIIQDYRDIKVLSFARKIINPDLHWVLVSEINYDEALKPILLWRTYIIIATVFILLIIVILTFFISRAISSPILYFKNILADLSKGIITPTQSDPTDESEIGQIGRAIQELTAGLKRTAVFAGEIGTGNFDASYTVLSNHDALGLALIQMRDKLRDLTDTRVRLLREKAASLLEGQEHERKRIVRDLHDGVGQLLTVIRLQAELLEHEPTLRDEILRLINETISEVKRISYDVMPNAIVDFGLEAALQGLCANSSKYASLVIDFNYVRESDHVLGFEIDIAIFRIVQEGLNNILKHAKASHVDLHVVDDIHQLYILLKDDGVGFDETSVSLTEGFGLKSMRERASLLNGSLHVYSSPGQGTVLEVTIPTPSKSAHA